VPIDVAIFGSNTRQIEDLLRSGSVRVTAAPISDLLRLAQPSTKPARAIVVDIRELTELPPALALLKREHPATGVVIVAAKADPAVMLAAMRAGVSEWVSEPIQQQELLAALGRVAGAAPTNQMGEVFAVVGSKGGVGTTTLAVNIATTLSAQGSTLLIDLHLAGGDAALFLGAVPGFSSADALENTHRLDQAFLKGIVVKTAGGPDLLASPEVMVASAQDPRRVRALVEFAAQCYQFVVLDVPRAEPAMAEALSLASTITVVATQELAAIRSGARAAALYRQKYGAERVRVVVNRYDRAADIGPDDLERAIGDRIVHKFPSNYRLAIDALNKGRPLVTDNHNKLASAFAAYACSLTKTPREEMTAERSAGLFGRLTGRR
jgi:pilus assembly protein CpaE